MTAETAPVAREALLRGQKVTKNNLASISTVMESANVCTIFGSWVHAKRMTNRLFPNQGMGAGLSARPEETKKGLWARLSSFTVTSCS